MHTPEGSPSSLLAAGVTPAGLHPAAPLTAVEKLLLQAQEGGPGSWLPQLLELPVSGGYTGHSERTSEPLLERQPRQPDQTDTKCPGQIQVPPIPAVLNYSSFERTQLQRMERNREGDVDVAT